MPDEPVTRHQLADLIEHHAGLVVAALRAPARPGSSNTRETHEQSAPPTAAVGAAEFGPSRAARSPGPGGRIEPWRKVGELEGETYAWPEGTEHYAPFEVWETEDGGGRVQGGLGRPEERGIYYGRERGYWVAFEMIGGQKRRPIVVFNEADDYEETGDLLAIIKGKGPGGRSMFAPGDELPAGYAQLRVEVFRDRIRGPQAFNRLAVVASGGDRQAMLDHTLLQLRLRS